MPSAVCEALGRQRFLKPRINTPAIPLEAYERWPSRSCGRSKVPALGISNRVFWKAGSRWRNRNRVQWFLTMPTTQIGR